MCWLVLAKPGLRIPDPWIKEAWTGNKDGAGYCFATKGELVIRKPFYKFGELLEAYNTDYTQYGQESAFALHLRFGTSGAKKVAYNCHPHIFNNGKGALLHNGMLWSDPPKEFDHYSDTAWFNLTVIDGRPMEQMFAPQFTTFLTNIIGSYNKIILMNNKGETVIANEAEGQWEDGFWVSNAGHRPAVKCCSPARKHKSHASAVDDYVQQYTDLGEAEEASAQIDELELISMKHQMDELEEQYLTATQLGEENKAERIQKKIELLTQDLDDVQLALNWGKGHAI